MGRTRREDCFFCLPSANPGRPWRPPSLPVLQETSPFPVDAGLGLPPPQPSSVPAGRRYTRQGSALCSGRGATPGALGFPRGSGSGGLEPARHLGALRGLRAGLGRGRGERRPPGGGRGDGAGRGGGVGAHSGWRLGGRSREVLGLNVRCARLAGGIGPGAVFWTAKDAYLGRERAPPGLHRGERVAAGEGKGREGEEGEGGGAGGRC